MPMTSPVERVTWLHIVTIVTALCSTCTSLSIPGDHDNIPTSLQPINSTGTLQGNDFTTTSSDPLTSTDDLTSITTATATTTSSATTISTSTSHQSHPPPTTLNTGGAQSTPPSTKDYHHHQQKQQQQQHPDMLRQTMDRVKSFVSLLSSGHRHGGLDNSLHPPRLQEQHLRSKVMESFVGLTRDVQLSPEFMFSLLLDMMVQYEKSSSSPSLGDEGNKTEKNEDRADAAAAADDDDNDSDDDDGDDYISHNYTQEDVDQSSYEISSVHSIDRRGFSPPKNESETDDIHRLFNRLLVQMIEQFSAHALSEEGHRVFFDSLLKVMRVYFDHLNAGSEVGQDEEEEEEGNGFDSNEDPWSGKFEAVRNETMKEMSLLLNLLEEAQPEENVGGASGDYGDDDGKAEIPELGIYEDLHNLLAKIIFIIQETGDAEVNQCIDRCIVGWQQRGRLLNQRFAVASENFMRRRNMSRDNWNERLVEIQSSSSSTNIRECRHPTPEVHHVNQYRYILPETERRSEVDSHSALVGGQRQGAMVPDHVELHRCRHRYGCCNHYADHPDALRICAAKKWTIIEKVHHEVFSDVIDEEVVKTNMTRLYKFVNETECHCKIFSKNNQICTSAFEFTDDDVNSLTCGCNVNSTSYSSCRDISRGVRSLSESDLRCIRLRKCIVPRCEFGQFDLSLSSCPRSQKR